jgi:large conductance mechanosensitive channel
VSGGKSGVMAGFKAFLMRGNVVELAVAVVVGTAFSKIVDSVVKGFINPVVGAVGTKELGEYRSCLRGPCEIDATTGEVTEGILIGWGALLSATLTFVITAAVVYFLMILPMTKYKERQAARLPVVETAANPTEIELLTEIRDALVGRKDEVAAATTPGVAPQRGSSDHRVSTDKR